jgi:hypothetical protein
MNPQWLEQMEADRRAVAGDYTLEFPRQEIPGPDGAVQCIVTCDPGITGSVRLNCDRPTQWLLERNLIIEHGGSGVLPAVEWRCYWALKMSNAEYMVQARPALKPLPPARKYRRRAKPTASCDDYDYLDMLD